MRNIFGYVMCLPGVLMINACIETYNPPEIQNNDDFLVVEGFLDAQNFSCTIRLSRTISLTSENIPEPAVDASVTIEDENNGRYLLAEQEPGYYSIEGMDVDPNLKYRLVIIDGVYEYQSDFVEVTTTPPIDSVYWRLEDDDEYVSIYLNTQNSSEGTGYYLWEFEETWQYNSAFRSLFVFQNGMIVDREAPDEFYYCWKSDPSTSIQIATTAGLEEDIISNYRLRTLPSNAKQFQTKYSILVNQYSLTKDAYDFWSQVRDNTQGTGSLFDVQPSRVKGNIRSVNDDRPIIGYFSAGAAKSKRIWIHSRDIPVFFFESEYTRCWEDSLLLEDIPTFEGKHLVVNELLDTSIPGVIIFLGYTISTPLCVDCRLKGGDNTRPDFWE